MDLHLALLALGAALFIAVFQVSIHRLATAAPDALILALERLHGWLAEAGRGLLKARTRLLVDICLDGGRWRTTAVLGGLIGGVAVLLVLLLSESVMVGLAMESLGLGSARLLAVLARLGGVDLVATVATVTCGLHAIWALKAFAPDSRSVLVVLDWHPPSSRRLLRWCAGVAAAGVLISVVGLAIVRAAALQEVERLDTTVSSAAAVPQGADAPVSDYEGVVRSARTVVGVASAVATLAEAAVAFALTMDLIAHLPVIGVAGLMACVAIMRWTVAAWRGLVCAVRHVLSLVVTAIAWMATPLARPPTELLRGLHRWARAERAGSAAGRAARGTVAALTAVGHDLQLPPSDPDVAGWAMDTATSVGSEAPPLPDRGWVPIRSSAGAA
ncbi:MAG: hypothetical protein AMXMBFR53_15540 [Gemmatimonadota bacterium]